MRTEILTCDRCKKEYPHLMAVKIENPTNLGQFTEECELCLECVNKLKHDIVKWKFYP